MVVFDGHEYLTEEERRLKQDRERTKYWKKWGSLCCRAAMGYRCAPVACQSVVLPWCTDQLLVREDYSADGDAWSHFTHEHARSRAFRWGEDGIAGVSDTHGLQNIAFSFWNEEECVTAWR
ncbi:hypothetical protein J3459_011957 [Metarhizium acridum]|nr:hypothetical protein J3459_011957 [Metarhizium acridum]